MELPHSLTARDRLDLELRILPSFMCTRTVWDTAQNGNTNGVFDKFWKEVTSKHYSKRKLEKDRSRTLPSSMSFFDPSFLFKERRAKTPSSITTPRTRPSRLNRLNNCSS